MRRALLTATLVLAAAASVWVFLAVNRSSHSVSDTFYGAAAPIGLVWLIALAVIALVRRTMPNP
jgi:hypothetical protein